MILSAQSIRRRCVGVPRPMISPFVERSVSHGRSYGLSSAGYDIRLAQDVWVWPLWGRLASAMERFDLPDDVVMEIKDKSSNARRFVLIQNTVAEPDWRGYLTLEITHMRPWPVLLRKGTPIAQVMFKLLDEPTEQPYRGKYQNQQAGPRPAIMEPSDFSASKD